MPQGVAVPAEPAESTEQSAAALPTFEQAAEAALAEHPIEEGGETGAQQTEQPAPATGGGQAEAEPEHVRWVKSQNGFVDQNGQILTDAVIKQAYELNRGLQTKAQEMASLSRMLSDPEVFALVSRKFGGGQPQSQGEPQARAKAEEPVERTDEEIFKAAVREEAQSLLEEYKKTIQPTLTQAQLAYRQFEESQFQSARQAMVEEFGMAEDGKTPVYDTIREEVGQRIAAVAAQSKVTVPVLMSYLVQNGQLAQVLSETAKTILFPKLREAAKTATAQRQQEQVQQAKKTNLPGKGTTAVKPAPKRGPMTFDEAVAAAEAEIASAR